MGLNPWITTPLLGVLHQFSIETPISRGVLSKDGDTFSALEMQKDVTSSTDISLLQNTMVNNETNTSVSECNISIYDAYIYYCKFIITYDPLNQIINKSYFDKYINENYSKYIIDNRFLSILWIMK